MRGIEDIEKILHPRAFLFIIKQHDGQGEHHHPLGIRGVNAQQALPGAVARE